VPEVVDVVIVDTDAICAAGRFEDTRLSSSRRGRTSPAPGLGESTAPRQDAGGVASGANTNFARLRFVAERAEVGEQREAVWR
jgi:threonine dehydratase